MTKMIFEVFFPLDFSLAIFLLHFFRNIITCIMCESRCPKVSLCKGFAFYRLLYFWRKSACLLMKLNWYLSLQTIHLQLTMSHNGGYSHFNIETFIIPACIFVHLSFTSGSMPFSMLAIQAVLTCLVSFP